MQENGLTAPVIVGLIVTARAVEKAYESRWFQHRAAETKSQQSSECDQQETQGSSIKALTETRINKCNVSFEY